MIHWYRKHYLALLSICITLLFTDVVIDPSNQIFHLKYVLFVFVFVIWAPSLLNKQLALPKSLGLILIFVCVFMPFYSISVGLINHYLQNTSFGEIVYFNSFFFFLLILITANEKIELTKIFNYSTLLIILITIVSYSILIYNPNTFGLLYDYFVVNKRVAIYGLRNYGDYTLLMMFYKTSPLLVFPLSYYLNQLLISQDKKHVLIKSLFFIAIAITLFLSGTRANLLSLLLIVLFYIFYFAYKQSKPLFFILGFALLLIATYGLSTLGGILLSASETSNMIKFGHVISYIEHFSNHIGVLIFGQGLGSTFYSSGVNSIVSITELTYFELIRIWGLPITLIFCAILIIPLYKEIKERKMSHRFIAYLAYLFIAGTNPLLLSSTGMLVFVYVFTKTYKLGSGVRGLKCSEEIISNECYDN